ncbi:MAG: methyltransferase domain-containing protein [Verrucomicrobiota bacterium]|jgi:SAM-dependent methyltransferase
MTEFEYNSAYFDGKMSDWTAISIGEISGRLLATLKEQTFPRDGIAVDFGCGSGAYLPYLKQSSLEVVGVDISPDAVKQAGQKPYKAVLLIDSGKAPVPDQSAAIVFSTEVLEHIEDAEAAVKEFNRLLKEGGLLILTTTLYFSSINVYLSTAIQKKHSPLQIIREVLRYASGFVSRSRQKDFVMKWCYLPLGGHFHGFKPGFLKSLICDAGFHITEARPLFIFEPIGFSRYPDVKSVNASFRFPFNLPIICVVLAISASNFCLKAMKLGANNIYLVARKTRAAA